LATNKSFVSNLNKSANKTARENENIKYNCQKDLRDNESSRFTKKSSFGNFDENFDNSGVSEKKRILLNPIDNSRLNNTSIKNTKIQNQTEEINKSINSTIKNSSVAYDNKFNNLEEASRKSEIITSSNRKNEKSLNKSNYISKLNEVKILNR